MKATPQVLKGMRDFLPARMILRHHVIDVVRRVFERFGFEPIQTPAVEYAETLEGKFGEEADKLIYKFEDRGGRLVGLRYDHTVPLARVVSMYPEIVKPFKRYQVAPVWRAERPQKGRYREFYQCDVDIVGSASMLADAEVVNVAYQCLRELGFAAFRILLNNRKILAAVARRTGLGENEAIAAWRAIDKWDKIGPAGVRRELDGAGFAAETIEQLFGLLDSSGSSPEVLATVRARLGDEPIGQEGVAELEEIVRYLAMAGVSDRFYQVDLHMVRGLEYYTGPIFEIVVDEPKIGSLSGGGRYDNLIGLLGPHEYPAVGIALGLERLIDVIDELGMAPASVRSTVTAVLVTVFEPDLLATSLDLASSLRTTGVNTEVYFGAEKLGAQLKYASRKNIPLVIIAGPDELSAGEVVVRNMHTGQQQRVERGALLAVIRAEMDELSHAATTSATL
ncbi:MAG TPA: histidine--tRNA ligase [Chloroflexota bacterium]|nr:histidine--tRNA ligase [Chloroflexota bacterium]